MGPLTAKNVAFKNQDKGEGRGANALTNKPLALGRATPCRDPCRELLTKALRPIID